MLMIGLKTVQEPLPSERRVCANCMTITDHTATKRAQRLTLYLIPLFTIRPEVIYTCAKCGTSRIITYTEYLDAHTPAPNQAQRDGVGGGGQKPHVVLNGKLVGDEIRTSLPFLARLNGDLFLKILYMGLAALFIVAVVMVIILLPGLAH